MGGKSAGHIVPLLTLARQNGARAVFITTHRALDKKIVNMGIHLPLYLPDIHLKKFWTYPFHALVWTCAFVRLTLLYVKARPERVISTGGLCAVPVFLFAKLFNIPCELFELNAMPGKAVTLLAPLSTTLFYCYTVAAKHLSHTNMHYRLYPVREITPLSTCEARGLLQLDPYKKTICFLGGSQGSQFINDFACKLLAHFSPAEIQVVHQTGSLDAERLKTWYRENNYTAYVVDYHSQIELLYSAADLIVCRAGAGTLWELASLHIPTCIIPLETAATDHQLHNAQALCVQKPQQFFMLRQSDAENNIACVMHRL